jgi:ADP-ribose pyrophosphatase YjhB (NUDIX family)
MQHIDLNLHTQVIPPIMLRGSHVLICLKDEQNRFVLGKKNMYPTGISRMVGGGIEGDEEPLPAALREIEEEVGLKLKPDDLTEIATITTNVEDKSGAAAVFVTYLFSAHVNSQDLKPDSDLDGLAHLNHQEMKQLIDTYAQLSDQIDSSVGFAWADYGKLYGPIHQLALQIE